MITASHNPAVYNGFKIIIQRQVISGKALQLLKPMLIAEKFTRSEAGSSSLEILSPSTFVILLKIALLIAHLDWY